MIVAGYDFYGNNLDNGFQAPDASHCRGACYANANCKAYTWLPDGAKLAVSVVTTDNSILIAYTFKRQG